MICLSSLSSGKPPLIFLSQMSCGLDCSEDPASGRRPLVEGDAISHTRNRPAVSSAVKGMSMMLLIEAPPDAFDASSPALGGEKVRKSSVWTHVARCCHLHLSQYCVRTSYCSRQLLLLLFPRETEIVECAAHFNHDRRCWKMRFFADWA